MPAGPPAAGLDAKLTGDWTAKAEYLYADLGRFNCSIDCGAASTIMSPDVDNHFGWGE
jgi:opacity protein-like surface antigen